MGHVLTAATSGIADQDGLSSPDWTYQWVRVEGRQHQYQHHRRHQCHLHAGGSGSGQEVRVKVSFTDDGNTAHTLESADSGVIAAAHTTAPEPVAAVNVTHKGSSLEVSWNAPAPCQPLRRDLLQHQQRCERQGGVESGGHQHHHPL